SFLSTYVGTLKYQVCITEDKIIGAQLMPTNQIDPNYEHNHVLRACVNGSFGESIATDPLSGDTQSLTHKFKLETGWKDADCHVVTFIYDATTYEVIQAEKVSF
ncbi:MAG: Omp28-related outer membrane protein, partial [Bacteroidota bacterium]|nr:Omp28-related outer membrane protein [Bacteroidota bacterium]MDX5428343.1 Omp28-related outer membrane protein [Bacteroidota bacterium]MDX5506117.1 Omp28-related outer membrane protein [Bacteroidota bacterium]